MRWLSLLLLAVALAVGGWARWVEPQSVEDLQFRPDALEYEEAARSLAHGDGYCLRMQGHEYPPRYPIGFPALIAPFLLLFGDGYGTGILAVFASALLCILAAWGLVRSIGCGFAAGIAALLIAIAPFHIRWSGTVMSDVPAAAAVAAVALWALSLLRHGGTARSWCVLGIMAGLTAAVRSTNLLVVMPIGLVMLQQAGWQAGRWRITALAIGSFLGLMPQLVLNALQFGSLRANGYAYWDPNSYGPDATTFAATFAFDAPRVGGSEANLTFYFQSLIGLANLHPWPMAALVLVGAAATWRGPTSARNLLWIGLGFTAILLAFYSGYFFQAERFLLPAMPLLAAIAAMSFAAWSPLPLKLTATGLLVAAVALGAPAFVESLPPMQSYFTYHAKEAATLREIDGRVEPNAAVLVRTNVFFCERLLRRDTERIWIPIEFCEHRRRIRHFGLQPLDNSPSGSEWIFDAAYAPFDPARVEDAAYAPFDRARVEGAINGLLRAGRPVYYSSMAVLELVAFGPQLQQLLEQRFNLEQVASGRWRLFRVTARR